MQEIMKRVFGAKDLRPYVVPSWGLPGWLLVRLGNLTLTILENRQGTDFPGLPHEQEEFVWVLGGQLEYRHGPVVKAGEAILIVPNVAHPGKYAGKLLVVSCLPEIESELSPSVMSHVIRPQNMKNAVRLAQRDKFLVRNPIDLGPSVIFDSGAILLPLVATRSLSIGLVECDPGAEFANLSHPEKEIAYVLQGQVEFNNGRLVRANEAVCNLPNAPHHGKYLGSETVRMLEIQSPPHSRFKFEAPLC